MVTSIPAKPAASADWNSWGAAVDTALRELQNFSTRAKAPSFFVAATVGDSTANRAANDAAIAVAMADMQAYGSGYLQFPPGIIHCTKLPTLTPIVPTGPLTYGVRGAGKSITTIKPFYSLEADGLTVNNPGFNGGNGLASTTAPGWSGFTLDGSLCSGTACGIVWGDVSYITFTDIAVKNFPVSGWKFLNGYGWSEGINTLNCSSEFNAVQQIEWDVGSGRQLGVISTALTSGTAYTSLAVSGGVSEAMYSGQTFVIAAAASAVGVTTQTVTTTAAVSAGATSIPVASFTAAAAYPAGTARVYFGGYGSWDYATFHSFYLQASANQHGWVSQVSRGLGQNHQRIGSKIRLTGNFRAGTTNTGKAFWIKGDDTYSDTAWDVAMECGGTGVSHQSIRIEAGNGAIRGSAEEFSLYGFTAATFGGGAYQCVISSFILNIQGVSDMNSNVNFRSSRAPGSLNVSERVSPAVYPTSFVSGTPWQNLSGVDVLVYITLTATTTTATASFNSNVWNGLPANPTMFTSDAIGQKVTMIFPHYNNMWARIDFTGYTVSLAISPLMIN